MFLKIKQKIKKNRVLNIIVRKILVPFYLSRRAIFLFVSQTRCLIRFSKKYNWIKELKGTKTSKRCFIVATGPSLTIEDLEMIKDEDTFSMNSIIKLYNKTNFRATYYMVQDEYVYQALNKEIYEIDTVYISSNIKKYTNHKSPNFFPLDMLNHKYASEKNKKFKVSKNSYYKINAGFSTVFSCIQLAIYMGYKEIYLLGADCDFGLEKRNVVNMKNNDSTPNIILQNRLFKAYNVVAKYARENNIEIYNCTRGGKLEIFVRKKLEDLFKNQKK